MAQPLVTLESPHTDERYGDRYLRVHPTWFVHEAPWKAREVVRMCERNGVHPDHVVDIGCGVGAVLRELAQLLPNATRLEGFDIAGVAVALAQEHATERMSFARRDVSELSEVDADLMLVLDVLDHVEDPFTFLRTIKPLARRTIFHMSLNLSAQKVLRPNALLARRVQGELHYFSKETALALLRETGFTVLDHAYTNMSLDLNDARGRLMDGSSRKPAIHWRNFLMRAPRRGLSRLSPDLAARLLGGYHLMVLAE